MTGLADFDTQHPYPNFGEAPAAWVNPAMALVNETGALGPTVYTETGYSTNGGTQGAVNADVQAKYTLDLLMDTAKDSVSKTDLYQLLDAYNPGSPQGDDGFGLFAPGNVPKEAALAIHAFTTILSDTGSTAASFTTKPLAYSVTGLPATGNSLVLEKSTGAYDVVVWNEPKIWNEAIGTELTAPAVAVTVQLGGIFQTVNIYDPLISASPIATKTGVSSVQLSLTDHPLVIEVGGTPAPLPTVTIGSQILAADTGASVTDGITSNGKVTLSGAVTGVAGTTVTVYDRVTILGTATLNGTGGWSFTTTLAAGAHALHAVAVDTAGHAANTGTSPAITVETAAPTVAISTPAQSLATTSTTAALTLNGTVTGAAGTVVTLMDGTTKLGKATLGANGTWSYAASLAVGAHAITATATDLAGNTTKSAADAITVTAPVVTAPPAPIGSDTLVLAMSEDAYLGNAQFTVAVDGQAIGGTQTVTALHSAGQSQSFTLNGAFGPGPHTVTIAFINDANGAQAEQDRNLYVNAITLNHATVFENTTLFNNGPISYTVQNPATPLPSNAGSADTLVLNLSEIAASGTDAQFMVSVDGQIVGGVQTVTALHTANQSQNVTLTGNFGADSHVVAVDFLNGFSGAAADIGRTFYVNAITLDGTTTTENATETYRAPTIYTLTAPTPAPTLAPNAISTDTASAAPITLGSGPETLALQISEDAYQGDAQFTVAINGVQIDGVQTATASHQAGDSQTVDINGSFGSVNTATLTFLNEAYAGTAATDRNLYLTGANLNGTPIASGVLTELSQGAQSFSFNDPAATATATSPATLHLAKDSSAGDAQFSVSVDGQAASLPQTVTASHQAGASQAFNLAAMAPRLHDVAVSFFNAAPGRDLYVAGIDVRNTPAPGASAMLTTNSTSHFAITVPSS